MIIVLLLLQMFLLFSCCEHSMWAGPFKGPGDLDACLGHRELTDTDRPKRHDSLNILEVNFCFHH